MQIDPATRSKVEVVDEVSKWGVGLGILIVALAPLSIPILVLTAAFLVPLLIPVLAIGLLAAPVLLVRAVVRRSRGRRRKSARKQPHPHPQVRSAATTSS